MSLTYFRKGERKTERGGSPSLRRPVTRRFEPPPFFLVEPFDAFERLDDLREDLASRSSLVVVARFDFREPRRESLDLLPVTLETRFVVVESALKPLRLDFESGETRIDRFRLAPVAPRGKPALSFGVIFLDTPRLGFVFDALLTACSSNEGGCRRFVGFAPRDFIGKGVSEVDNFVEPCAELAPSRFLLGAIPAEEVFDLFPRGFEPRDRFLLEVHLVVFFLALGLVLETTPPDLRAASRLRISGGIFFSLGGEPRRARWCRGAPGAP